MAERSDAFMVVRVIATQYNSKEIKIIEFPHQIIGDLTYQWSLVNPYIQLSIGEESFIHSTTKIPMQLTLNVAHHLLYASLLHLD